MSSTSDMMVKLLMLGDSGVGKSSLLTRFSDDTFTPTFTTTTGIDFKIMTPMTDGRRLKMQIWDTAGQERFQTVTNAYYKGVHGILVVYDITDRASFDSVRKWMSIIDQQALDSVERILIGNKADSEATRVVSTEQGQALAAEYGIKFYECSAKTNLNVTDCFMDLALQSVSKRKDKSEDDAVKIDVKPRVTKCC